jgi:hypothetical protein
MIGGENIELTNESFCFHKADWMEGDCPEPDICQPGHQRRDTTGQLRIKYTEAVGTKPNFQYVYNILEAIINGNLTFYQIHRCKGVPTGSEELKAKIEWMLKQELITVEAKSYREGKGGSS